MEKETFFCENKYPTLYVKDFGKIAEAEIELAPFTLFIGDNNSGKSYLLNLIWGLQKEACHDSSFFSSANKNYIKDEQAYKDLTKKLDSLKDWTTTKETKKIDFATSDITNIMILINKMLDAQKDNFVKDLFNSSSITLDVVRLFMPKDFNIDFSVEILEAHKQDSSIAQDKYPITIRLRVDGFEKVLNTLETLNANSMERTINILVEFILSIVFPSNDFQSRKQASTFLPIARTGFLLTYKELAKNALSNTFQGKKNDSLSSTVFLQSTISFMHMLLNLNTRYSNGQDNTADAKEIIAFIENEIIDGTLLMHPETGEFLYTPKNTSVQLAMHMTSAIVTELAPLILYLKYHYLTDALFMEEPEIALHPELQQKITQALIKLINTCDKQVFISTHSDTIIQHINNMIKLENNPMQRKYELFTQLGYNQNDTIKREKVRMYQFDVDNSTKKTKISALASSKYGFRTPTFVDFLDNQSNQIDELLENL